MKDQLVQTWQTHQQMNELLLDNTTDEGLAATLSSRGGRTVYQQWAHLHQVRLQWLEHMAPDLFQQLKPVATGDKPDRKALKKALGDSAKAIAAVLAASYDKGGKVKGFKSGTMGLLGYLIAHESHHRGNMLLTLKQSGEKIPDNVKWGLWKW